jgi:hypothetical protein
MSGGVDVQVPTRGVLAIGAGLLLGSPSFGLVTDVDETPLSQTMAFDPGLNMIVRRDETAAYGQQFSPDMEYRYVEAEDMVDRTAGDGWQVSPHGLPALFSDAKWGAPHLSGTGVAMAKPAEAVAEIRRTVALTQGGKYTLWVRYETVRGSAAAFLVVLRRGDKEVASHRFNDTSAALDDLGSRLLWEAMPPVDLSPGEVEIALIKPPDGRPSGDGLSVPKAGPRSIDAILLTNHTSYRPSGQRIPSGLSDIRARLDVLKVGAERAVLTWMPARFGYFDAGFWPESTERLDPSLEFTLPQGATENRLLLLTSASAEPLAVQPVLEWDAPDAGAEQALDVKVVAQMESRYFGWVPNALLARRTIGLGPYRTAGLWVGVNTERMRPGTQSGRIRFEERGRTVAVTPFRIRVTAARIEKRPEMLCLLWEGNYSKGYPAEERAAKRLTYTRHALAYGQNVFRGAPRCTYAEALELGVKAFIVGGQWTKTDSKDEFVARWRVDFEKHINEFRALGYPDGVLWVEAFDEPTDARLEFWLGCVQAAKEIAPDAKIWVNPPWEIKVSQATLETMARFTDVWWPFVGNLTVPGRVEFLKATGKPVGYYNERGQGNLHPTMSYRYYRRLPLLVARYDLQGLGFWAHSFYYSDPWDDLDTSPNYPEAAVVYPGTAGPVETLNLRAWREGYDHLLALYSLRQLTTPADRAARAAAFLDAASLARQDELRRDLWDELERQADQAR